MVFSFLFTFGIVFTIFWFDGGIRSCWSWQLPWVLSSSWTFQSELSGIFLLRFWTSGTPFWALYAYWVCSITKFCHVTFYLIATSKQLLFLKESSFVNLFEFVCICFLCSLNNYTAKFLWNIMPYYQIWWFRFSFYFQLVDVALFTNLPVCSLLDIQ